MVSTNESMMITNGLMMSTNESMVTTKRSMMITNESMMITKRLMVITKKRQESVLGEWSRVKRDFWAGRDD
jgi:hypothetical protein